MERLRSGQVRSVCWPRASGFARAFAAVLWVCSSFAFFKLPSAAVPISQGRELNGCGAGGVTLAVNGRTGRRVACVRDEAGLRLEVLDMEGEEEEVDLEEAGEAEGSG